MTGLFPLLLTLGCLFGTQTTDRPDPKIPSDSIAVAREHLAAGRADRAIPLLESRIAQNPDHGVAWFLLGSALQTEGRWEEAYSAHERASRFRGVAGAACYNAARASALLGDPDEALRWIDRAWQSGFRDLDHAREDGDLASLHEDTRFSRLLTKLENSRIAFPDHIQVLHTIEGGQVGEQFGWVAIDAGDVDGDGAHDAAIGAPYAGVEGHARAGRVEVRSGRTGRRLHEFTGTTPSGLFGTAVGAAGDIDRDGRADVVVGAPGLSDDPGRISVHSGNDGSILRAMVGEQNGSEFGAEARGVGDWNSDGVPDLLIGAPGFDGPAGNDAGRAWILSGDDLAPLHTFDGERAGDRLGRAGFGTVRGDERYLVLGAGRAGPGNHGRAYLYRGPEATRLATVGSDAEGGSLGEMFVSVIGDIDADGVLDFSISDWRHRAWGKNTGRVLIHSGANGRRLRSLTGKSGEGFGIGDGIVGDVDGDGHDDLLVGAWLSSRGASQGGSVFLISGRNSEVLYSWHGRTAADHVGFDATGLGDVNGDGCTDYLVTAASSSVTGPDTGRVFILAGPSFLCSEPVQGKVPVVRKVRVRGRGAK